MLTKRGVCYQTKSTCEQTGGTEICSKDIMQHALSGDYRVFFLQETNVTNWNVLSMSNVYYVWFSESQALIYLKSIDMQTERQ